MARPIKDTPVLKGKDAVKFLERISVSENKRVDEPTRKRIYQNYEILKKAAKF